MRDKKGRFIKGYKHTEEWKKQKAKEMKGNKHWDNPVCKANQFKKGHKSVSPKSGKGHPLYKYGCRGGKLWATWRNGVLGKADYKCEQCGGKKGLMAHHIKPWEDYPELKFEISNGKALCGKCHFYKHFKRIL